MEIIKTIFNKIWNLITSEWNIFKVGLAMPSAVSREYDAYLYDSDNPTDNLSIGDSPDCLDGDVIVGGGSLLDSHGLNPATGLPMTDGMCDMGGNIYGSDSMRD